MLVLARKLHQKIIIGDNIIIQVLHKSRDVVKLGIQAPLSIPVHRQEVYEEIQRNNHAALHKGPLSLAAVAPKIEPVASGQPHEVPSDPVPTH